MLENINSQANISFISEKATKLHDEVSRVVVGQNDFIEKLIVLLLSGGHGLIEGVPGLGKTLAARVLAKAIKGDFKRVQFTPDLMPTDVTGTKVFDSKTSDFYLKKGPVFTDILLADEINRTAPKTQSALLECMEERTVTIDGQTHSLGENFTVLATQNPVEYEGTYPLPEAQLDRFMMKLMVGYLSKQEENDLLQKVNLGFNSHKFEENDINVVCTLEDISACKKEVQKIVVKPEIINYITSIILATRNSQVLLLGASPRASISLLTASKTLAAIRGRDFVIPEDIKELCLPILRHRILLKPEAGIEGIQPDDVIARILNGVEIPR